MGKKIWISKKKIVRLELKILGSEGIFYNYQLLTVSRVTCYFESVKCVLLTRGTNVIRERSSRVTLVSNS